MTREEAAGIVNVANVPQRSPFRYPGGKTWLVPVIRQWLGAFDARLHLIEPFAGGAVVGLTAAFEGLASRVTLAELDEDVCSVWRTIFGGNGEWLAQSIETLPATAEAVDGAIAEAAMSTRARALATIVRNRVNRGGILAPGAGRIKHGENGRGMFSRWYPATLAQRIRAIAGVSGRMGIVQADGVAVIREYAGDCTCAFFIDPPYTVAGRRLYLHNQIDHAELFDAVSEVAGQFLMTYDDAQEIQALADHHGFCTERIPMKTTHHSHKWELLVSRSFDWLRK